MRERWTPAVVGATGLVLGGLTSTLQTWLPEQVASLANSAGPWCAIAFGLARLGRRPWVAAALGALALTALDVGYYLTAAARGFATGTASVAFWVVAALLVGPVIGIGARWLDARRPIRQACAAVVLPAILVLEGVRSLAEVGDTTYRPYWVGEILVGLGLAAVLGARAWTRSGDRRRPA